MKALRKHKKGAGLDTLKLMDIPEPTPGKDEIKIKIIAIGICGTDIHIMMDEFVNNPPVTIGHEYIGIVCDKGNDVKDFEIGDHVVSLTAVKTCGKCHYCYQDLRMLCDERQSIGCMINGAMAEYLVIPANVAFKIPDGIEINETLTVLEPVACVVRGVIEKSVVKAGNVVVVSGPGAIGQLTAQIAKAHGAYVMVTGLKSDIERLKLAKELGADSVASSVDEIKQLLKSVAPNGADVVFECSGAESSARTCIDVVKKTGIFTQIGLYGKDIKMDMDRLLNKELVLTSTFATERTSWEICLKLLKNNQLNLKPLISKTLPIEKWEEGFDLFMKNEGFKTVLIP
ncbi:MAG: alcohol dehydrogenase catalytic domain-containing protein [Clostridia bacterium]|nr:alcohol dehydrogenase catalytic domain-containing protein [Clostridia bacterium]